MRWETDWGSQEPGPPRPLPELEMGASWPALTSESAPGVVVVVVAAVLGAVAAGRRSRLWCLT
jgi:hypothetical protein